MVVNTFADDRNCSFVGGVVEVVETTYILVQE